jgi:hypothetical protein
MQRRTLLKIGFGSAVVLGVAAAGLALIEPGMRDGRLTAAGRAVFAAVARAVLEGALPAEAPSQAGALQAHLRRLDELIGNLPPAARDQLGQLVTLLASPAGRVAFAGLAAPWSEADTAQVGQALQGLRLSSLELRQQAYDALRDLTNGAYFSDPSSWALLGYPGPSTV